MAAISSRAAKKNTPAPGLPGTHNRGRACIVAAVLAATPALADGGPRVGLEEVIRLQPTTLVCDIGGISRDGYRFITVACALPDGRAVTWYVPDLRPAPAYVGPTYADWSRLVGKTNLACEFSWSVSSTPICPGL